ncbi:MAG: IclR family transcriptional regulator, partial [Mesorhizobium sp.]
MAASVADTLDDGEAGRSGYRVPAVDKALDVLEFMASSAETLTQTEIAAGLGRSIHEIYRILLLLEKRGYIFRTQSDRFRLSLKLFELAHMH